MPKHLLVDGFNVIRRDPQLNTIEQKNFYGAQELLIQRLADYCRGTQHRITVVFDGARGPNPWRQQENRRGVKVIYSGRGETADEVIKDILANREDRDGFLAATADRDLARACRALGVAVISPGELLRSSRPRPLPPEGHEYWQGKREETGWVGHTRKKGNARRLPKAKRKSKTLW